MSFNKNSASASNNKYAVLAQQFTRKCQSSDPLPAPTRAILAPPAHALARDKSPCAPAQSSSSGAPAPSTSNNQETSSKKPVLVTTVQPLKVVKKSKPGSYAHATARGISPGSTITLWSQSKSPHPIWDPACPRIEEWYKVEKLTLYTVSHFHYRYRRHVSFSIRRTGLIKWHIELTPGNPDCSVGWRKIDHLARGDESYEIIGSYPRRGIEIAEENSYRECEGCPRK